MPTFVSAAEHAQMHVLLVQSFQINLGVLVTKKKGSLKKAVFFYI